MESAANNSSKYVFDIKVVLYSCRRFRKVSIVGLRKVLTFSITLHPSYFQDFDSRILYLIMNYTMTLTGRMIFFNCDLLDDSYINIHSILKHNNH